MYKLHHGHDEVHPGQAGIMLSLVDCLGKKKKTTKNKTYNHCYLAILKNKAFLGTKGGDMTESLKARQSIRKLITI